VVEAAEGVRIQLLFRQVNDRIHTVGTDRFGIASDEPLALVCECATLSCVERLQLPARDLQRARSSAANFVVVPGHESPDSVIVERQSAYVVVAVDEALLDEAGG
jgi:hypothetical protein